MYEIAGVKHNREAYENVDRTLDKMAEYAKEYRSSAQIRDLAHRITRGINFQRRDEIANQIWEWIRREIRYVPDPAGVELLQAPDRVLESGHADCDGMATLSASLLMAMGIPSGFRIVAWEQPGKYQHVYTVYEHRPGAKLENWHIIDTVGPDAQRPGPDRVKEDAVDFRTESISDMSTSLSRAPLEGGARVLGSNDGLGIHEGGTVHTGDFLFEDGGSGTTSDSTSEDDGQTTDQILDFAKFVVGQGPEYLNAWRQGQVQPPPGVPRQQVDQSIRRLRQQQGGGMSTTTKILLGAGAAAGIAYFASR